MAGKLGLELRTVEGFTRQGGGALGADRKVIEAVFSDEVLQERQNSPAINVGDESVVVLRVTDHKAPAQRPLEEVRAEVEAGLRAEAASKAAAEAARDAVAKLTSGRSIVEVATGLPNSQLSIVSSLSRNDEGVPPELHPGHLQGGCTCGRPDGRRQRDTGHRRRGGVRGARGSPGFAAR